jgi:hypothetical protein
MAINKVWAREKPKECPQVLGEKFLFMMGSLLKSRPVEKQKTPREWGVKLGERKIRI